VCVEGGGLAWCRVSINLKMREGGEEDGCRSASSDNGVSLMGGGGGGRRSEREQSASRGRDIAVSNKQTND